MSQSDSDHFKSKIRTIFWPIKRYELAKFIPMAALMFCVLFNQNILRILKDSILISEISAEITSFAKVYCVTPAATIFVIIYAKLINHLTFEKIFYHLVSFFTGFYVIFKPRQNEKLKYPKVLLIDPWGYRIRPSTRILVQF